MPTKTKKYVYLLLVLVIMLLVPAVQSKKTSSDAKKNDSQVVELPDAKGLAIAGDLLRDCQDGRLGVRFLCDYEWRMHKKDNALVFILDSSPDARMKIVKIDVDISFVHQLSKEKLESIGQYEKGFAKEEVKVAGLNALKVKAFARDFSETRLSDYYVVHNNTLYALMFSVNPKDRWDDYKFEFQKIVQSFGFL